MLSIKKSDDTEISVFAQEAEQFLNTMISNKIFDYIHASKEAFCDIWAIRIINCSIPEYIVFLLEMLRKSYSEEVIIKALKSNYKRVHKIEIPSFKYRVALLIHMHIKTDETGNTLETMFKALNPDKYLSACLEEMVTAYNNMYMRNATTFDELFEMAFGYVERSF